MRLNKDLKSGFNINGKKTQSQNLVIALYLFLLNFLHYFEYFAAKAQNDCTGVPDGTVIE